MSEQFKHFLSQFSETNATLDYFTDFKKIKSNVNKISIKLNQLNYLIGKENLKEAVNELYQENPNVFEVLDILIDNSLRHGSGRTSISVMRRNEWAVLTIRDEGYGIDEKIKDKLMTYGTTTTGNGIGLVWAKNQVLHDGGQLEITSLNPAVFSLSLRLDPINYGLNQIGNN